jgi:GNAT superfamily N-acetyltransferase
MTSVRAGSTTDAPALARLVNVAYEAERFFVRGDRTSPAEILAHMARGQFLVCLLPDERVVGCVYIDIEGARAEFGMLAVDPTLQGRGLGGKLVREAERRALDAGCRTMEIRVVNVRTDLLPWYERLGYRAVGTAPYVHRPTIQPCHFVVMQKDLGRNPVS